MKKNFNLWMEYFPKLPFILFVRTLQKILGDYNTILDLGCGELSPLRFLTAKTCGVDAHKPTIIKAQKAGTHDEFKLLNVKDIRKHFKQKSYDAVVALDIIEHLSKNEGYELIRAMEFIASKKVVIFTPNGFHPQKGNTHFEEHLSGWYVDEMVNLGYKVLGMFGLKVFRVGEHKIRFYPEIIWGVISEVSEWLYARWRPKSAAAILCIKEFKRPSTS